MYEIWSLGHKPFEEHTNLAVAISFNLLYSLTGAPSIKTFYMQVVAMIEHGFRLPPPPGCLKSLYSLMIQSWWVHSTINIRNSLLSYLSIATVTIGTLRPPTAHHSATCSTLWRRWSSRKRTVAMISCFTWERHSSWERTFIQTFKIHTLNSAALRTNNEIFLLCTYQNVITSSCYAFIAG